MFIVFEGIDGSGKTTQARLLAEHLRRARGIEPLLVREPGGTDLGEKLREILLSSPEDLAPETEVFLFMAARSHLVRTRILPAVREGRVVISDRFIWSTAVYQGTAAGIDPREILRLRKLAAPGLAITRTFLIDVDPESAYRRVRAPNRMEARGLEFQKRLRRGFLALARTRSHGIVLVDGGGSVEQVHRRVLSGLPARGWSCSSP
ncbi:MAG: dTMP kinase [Planctomycetes bacterium]|nr:dTMP kinase [Planctomycetota bacterium]